MKIEAEVFDAFKDSVSKGVNSGELLCPTGQFQSTHILRTKLNSASNFFIEEFKYDIELQDLDFSIYTVLNYHDCFLMN